MHTTPVSLLERMSRANDRAAAWSRFVELYTPMLFEWTARLHVPEQDAADLVQNVFLTLVRQMPHFHYDQAGSFRGWLRTVLLHRYRDQLRRRQLPAARESVDLDSLGGPDPVKELAEVEYRGYLAGRALRLMQSDFAPSTWRACWETVVRERPAADVAAELNLTVAAVYTANSRVLRRLREELDGLLD
jgi:RNA polymerase sigma-70 factor (ECF subfamily)